MLESLESRRLFSATVTLSDAGALQVVGSGGNDTLVVGENHGAVHVDVNNGTQTFDFVGVTSVYINGGGGTDTIQFNGNSIGAQIDGSGGNQDSITVDDRGTGSSNVLGGGGTDVITVIHSNNTTVDGGGGKDLFYLNTSNVDTGQGNNSVVYAYGVGDGKDVFTSYAQVTVENINGTTTTVISDATDIGTAYLYADKNDTIIVP